jgi:hypothetical protein
MERKIRSTDVEKHFLDDFVAEQGWERCQNPDNARVPWYNHEGDCVEYLHRQEAVVAERIDEILTILRSAEDDMPIGYQVKGITALLQKLGYDGISIRTQVANGQLQKVSLALLLLTAYESGPQTVGRREAYAQAFASPTDELVFT